MVSNIEMQGRLINKKKMNRDIIMQCQNISKFFGTKEILKDISFECKKGEAIALVGLNGCGKSTLIRILAGATNQTSGNIRYSHKEMKMSLLPDHYEKVDISVNKFLQFTIEAYELKAAQEKLKDLCKTFHIENLLDIPMKYLSKGSLQKVAAIQALVCDNELLFMDEPLSGQDMLSKFNFIQEILKRKQDGMSIIFACHEKELIEDIADRVLLIDNGKLSDGYQYLYHSTNKKGTFILANLSEVHLTEIHHNFHIDSFHRIGNKCRIISDHNCSNDIFQLCIRNNIKIIRYEEIEL